MQGTLAREHISTQGTLARDHVSTQGTLAREHVFSTQGTQFSRLVFYCKQTSRFILRHLTLKKSLKGFITEYIPDFRFSIS